MLANNGYRFHENNASAILTKKHRGETAIGHKSIIFV